MKFTYRKKVDFERFRRSTFGYWYNQNHSPTQDMVSLGKDALIAIGIFAFALLSVYEFFAVMSATLPLQ